MRRRLLCAVVAAGALAALPGSAAARDARLTGAFTVAGRVTVADHVRGERRGQKVRRRWSFASTCASGPCRRVRLSRRRAAGATTSLTLKRTGAGRYAGSGRFTIPVRCAGHTYRRGGLVPYEVAVTITSTARVRSTRFATGIRARYRNDRRVNRTPCPGGLGHDAGRYRGARRGALPAAPTASFGFARTDPLRPTFAFTDTSRPGAGGAAVVARAWSFGDPASGAANGATGATPSHRFVGAGAHPVTLHVRDGNGLTATVRQTVTP